MTQPCDNGAPKLSYEGHNVIAAGNVGLNWSFVHGPALDDPLMGLVRWATGNKKVFFWVTDGQGRHLAFADSTGRLISGDYEVRYAQNGGKYAGGTSSASSFQADRFSTPTIPGVSFFRNRAYDRETGRWTQEDPIGVAGGINLYQFNGNNPVMFTDPFGLTPCQPPGSCQAKGVAIGSGVGATVGGIVAVGCTVSSGVCGLAAGWIVEGFSGAGATAGGLVGTVLDHTGELGSVGSQVVNSVKSKAKEWVTAVLILLGGGKTDIEVQPQPPPAAEPPVKRPKKDGDPDNPPSQEGS